MRFPCTLILLAALPIAHGAEASWVDASFEDFSRGSLDHAGQNLYVTQGGSVRTIHRFDLNDDGWIDLMFNGTHDYTFERSATVGVVPRTGALQSQSLDVKGSSRVVVQDLNHDGFPDAVFCPNDNWVDDRRFLTIAWGGPDGWSNARLNGALPVHGAKQLAVADFDHDGWPDIAVLCSEAWLPGQPKGRLIRIYWGSAGGYLLSHRSDFGVADAVDIKPVGETGALAVLTKRGTVEIFGKLSPKAGDAPKSTLTLNVPSPEVSCVITGDLNGDGLPDVVVGTRASALYAFLGNRQGGWDAPTKIAERNVSDISLADLDGDGRTDLVVSYFEDRFAGDEGSYNPHTAVRNQVCILWGDKDGFVSQPLEGPEFTAISASAIGDLNGDGRPDIAFARNHDAQSFFTDSLVLLNQGGRRFERAAGRLATAGGADVGIAPAQGDSPGRALFANAIGAATLEEKVDSFVYWGGPNGFDVQHRWTIPGTSGFQAAAADLNADGFVDIIAPYFGHDSTLDPNNPFCGINIFWGRKEGFSETTPRTVLHETGILCVNVADLNKDGYLDIIAGQQFQPAPGVPQSVIIYYGGPNGFSPERRVAIPSPGRSVPIKIADINGDGWLDIVTSSRLAGEEKIRILYGSPTGFSEHNEDVLPFFSALDLELADLNGDGRLDLIASARADKDPTYTDIGVWIFWGNSDGHFRSSNAQWLPGAASLGLTVADWDGDGYLDLMCPCYHAGPTRDSVRNILYWGSKDGFSIDNKTEFVTNAASDALAADFNHDGLLDLAIVVHTSNGGHDQDSKVYYNDGHRFKSPKITDVPAVGPHWMWGDDMGRITDRRWEQVYLSAPRHWEAACLTGSLEFTSVTPDGARLKFEVRSAASETGLEKSSWQEAGAGAFKLRADDRWIQYRATFISPNGDRFPVLQRVHLAVQ